jgi:hypothetical protein
MTLITTNYRQIPAISNSDLTEFRNYLFGRPNFKPQRAFDFDAALHEMILEPKKLIQAPESVDRDLVQHLNKSEPISFASGFCNLPLKNRFIYSLTPIPNLTAKPNSI